MENPYIVVEQKQEKKRRGALAILLAIAFCAILAIGSTFAYLTWTTNQTANRMTTDPNVTADLLEPAWTQALGSDDKVNLGSDNVVIPANANNMVPGSVVAKNPFVVNTTKQGDEYSNTTDAYAGMKLQFQKWVNDGTTAGSTSSATAADLSSHTETGHWVNMTSAEVDALLKVYAFSTDIASATTSSTQAGLNNYVAESKSGEVTIPASGNGVGAGWVQITSGDKAGKYKNSTLQKGHSNDSGAMYFYNTEAIMPESVSEASGEAATGHGDVETASTTDPKYTADEAKTQSNNWNITYTAPTGDNADKIVGGGSGDTAQTKASNKRTTTLFNSVRYVDTAKQSEINTLNNYLKAGVASTYTYTAVTADTNTRFKDGFDYGYQGSYSSDGSTVAATSTDNQVVTSDPGWRVVISGAAIQAAKNTAGTAYVKKAEDFASDSSNENWVDLLDAQGTADGANVQKPKEATGIRGATTNSKALGVSGIPNPSQINKDGKWINANNGAVNDNGGGNTSNIYNGNMG